METRFENSCGRRSKLGMCLILDVFGDRNVKFEAWHRRFWQWAIIGAVVVEPYFKGIQPLKLVKRIVHFILTLFWRYWTIDRHKSIQYENICRWHLIFGSVYMPSIGDPWPIGEVTKFFFSTNNTFHSIIIKIGVVLCKINEEINYVSVFHNHVRIWLRNWPVKLMWNGNKNT